MSEFSIELDGLDELLRKFESLRTAVKTRAVFLGLTAAALPVFREVQSRTPERDESERDENEKQLYEFLQTKVELLPSGQGGQATINFGRKTYLALWLEYGHRMIGHAPDKRQLHGPKTPDGKVVPGGIERNYPFIRTGFDAATAESTEAFFTKFQQEVVDSWENG